jgi:chemotaxis signal transduction protein
MMVPATGGASCWTTIGVWGRDEPRCAELQRVVHCRNCEVFAAAAQKLLDREPPSGHGEQEAGATTDAFADEGGAGEPVLVFRLADEFFALAVTWVTEVAEWRVIRSVPHRPDDLLLGIANVSGEVRLCISLEDLFGQPRPDVRRARPAGRLLVIGRGGPEWVAPVDEALSIHSLAARALEAAPATVARSAQAFLLGMFPWRGRRVGLLDGDLVLGAIARRLA